MSNSEKLQNWIRKNSNLNSYIFLFHDFRCLFPELSLSAYRTMLSRAASKNIIIRICKGVYANAEFVKNTGNALFHIAGLLRSNEFNYVSLETILSEYGVISQTPINRIMVLSSGRTSTINCGQLGSIEFIHTQKKPAQLACQLHYDSNCKMWKASIQLALQDMKQTHRNLDLINWEIVNEFI